jgi:hypothetical protein
VKSPAAAQLEQLEAVYEIDYPLPNARPATVRIEQELLKEFSRLGQPWVAIFVVHARLAHEKESSQLLLMREEPLEIACQWDSTGATTMVAAAPTTFTLGVEVAHQGVDRAALFPAQATSPQRGGRAGRRRAARGAFVAPRVAGDLAGRGVLPRASAARGLT